MVFQRLTRRCCLPAALFLSLCFLSAVAAIAGTAPAVAAPAAPDADPLTEAGRWELFGRGALNDVFFVDGTYGWAAGTGVWKTTDGGATWRRIPVLAGTTLRRIVFADRNRGWGLGDDNRVLRTEDGGETWLLAQGGRANWYLPPLLEYQPPNDLWTVGLYDPCPDWCDVWEDLVHSTDGGSTWTGRGDLEEPCPACITADEIEALDFFDRAHGWIVADGTMWSGPLCPHKVARTSDNGQTWAYACLPVGDLFGVTVAAIGFGSTTHGWLAADAGLWRSTDGGDTWAEQHTFAANLSWLQAEDASHAWVQHGASLWRTTDGGTTWQLLTEAAPTRVSFRTSLEGWGTDGSSIFKSSDSGRTWRPVFTLPAARPQEWFWDPLTGWRTVGAAVERTTDGGATWKTANPGLQGIDAFQFVDARNGWAWHNASLGLAHTTDGGATWRAQNTGSAALTDLQFVDAWHGWVHNQEQVRGTVDGGQSWHELPSPPLPPTPCCGGSREFRLLFIDATRGWAAITIYEQEGPFGHQYSSLAHTTDGGSSWGPLESVPVEGVRFLDRDHGFGWYRRGGYYRNPLYWGI